MSQNLHDHFVTICLHKRSGCKHVSVIQICKIFKDLDDILIGLIVKSNANFPFVVNS